MTIAMLFLWKNKITRFSILQKCIHVKGNFMRHELYSLEYLIIRINFRDIFKTRQNCHIPWYDGPLFPYQ